MFFLCCFIYGDVCGYSWCPLGGTLYSREPPEQLCGSEKVTKTYTQKVVCSKIGEISILGEQSLLKTTEEDEEKHWNVKAKVAKSSLLQSSSQNKLGSHAPKRNKSHFT